MQGKNKKSLQSLRQNSIPDRIVSIREGLIVELQQKNFFSVIGLSGFRLLKNKHWIRYMPIIVTHIYRMMCGFDMGS